MFDKILIANRGEIACRIIRTARRLGIATVAVHSDADASALHVALADEAVRIGPAAAAESYLAIPAILAAARATGCQAIHPGYGFLSENPGFAEAVAEAGLAFIGPSAAAIRAMGLKDAAKRLMAEAGVPVVPGYHGEDQDDALLADQAALIGYPVLVKAVAGGGGKGMRRVDHPRDFAAALASARSEADAAFGNPAVLIEKFVPNPRHVEIQVFGDDHGNVVHLFERDCSLQRRHQKVIEEAPAPGMTPETRAAMGAAAVQAARAIGYTGAGTVEFIAEGGGGHGPDGARGLRPDGFWFMEMNTRLQVEHPVTEAVTGTDLVEWQIRVAAGEPLPLAQSDLVLTGHAVEARLYAEDPARGFLPATGTLARLAFPDDVRVDTGVREGDAITPHYDPLIAKVIAHGRDRATALTRLARALAETTVAGSTTNLGFLARLVSHPEVRAGRLDTGLIDRHLAALAGPRPPSPAVRATAALAALGLLDARDPFTGFALWAPLLRLVALRIGDETWEQAVAVEGRGRFRVDGRAVAVTGEGDDLRVTLDGARLRLRVAAHGAAVTVLDGAEAHVAVLPDSLAGAAAAAASGDEVRAPMPGLVKRLAARPGQAVEAGEILAVLEAMKMEHGLAAPRAGVVAEVHVEEGAQVSEGSLLLALEPAS
jgi:3-methylcrotonyl-CoA carboxylase alpha subunit